MYKRNQKGQGMIEYVALTALVAIVCIGTVKLFGSKVRTRLNQVTNTFDRNIQQGLKTRTGETGRGSNSPWGNLRSLLPTSPSASDEDAGEE